MLAAILVVTQVFPQKDIFTPAALGSKHEVFASPDRVTVMRVVPVLFDKEEAVQYGHVRARPVGPEHEVDAQCRRDLFEVFNRRHLDLLKLCAFSPDHVVTFYRGADSLQVVTCFSCQHFIVFADKVNGASLPQPARLYDMLRKWIPDEEVLAAKLPPALPARLAAWKGLRVAAADRPPLGRAPVVAKPRALSPEGEAALLGLLSRELWLGPPTFGIKEESPRGWVVRAADDDMLAYIDGDFGRVRFYWRDPSSGRMMQQAHQSASHIAAPLRRALGV